MRIFLIIYSHQHSYGRNADNNPSRIREINQDGAFILWPSYQWLYGYQNDGCLYAKPGKSVAIETFLFKYAWFQ